MRVGELPQRELAARLANGTAHVQVGQFLATVESKIHSFAEDLRLLYAHHPLYESVDFADFHVSLKAPLNPRRWLRPVVGFYMDGRSPFKPLPRAQVFPLFEWGLNWCISSSFHTYLIFHAAVLERNSKVIVMPGVPGAGKSTLAAAMAHRGWRLFSDELALISVSDGLAVPVPKTISLKNESIEVIRKYLPDAVLGPVAHDTIKGSVAHLRAPENDVSRAAESVQPGWIVFPEFQLGAETSLSHFDKGSALLRLAENAFNYSALGRVGFEIAAEMIAESECYEFCYSDLDDGIGTLTRLADA